MTEEAIAQELAALVMPDGTRVEIAKINSAYDLREYNAQLRLVNKLKRVVKVMTVKELENLKKRIENRMLSAEYTKENMKNKNQIVRSTSNYKLQANNMKTFDSSYQSKKF